MSEVIEVIRVAFMAFVAFCAMQLVGPGYVDALRTEAAKVYSARKVGSEWVEIEKSMPSNVEVANRKIDERASVEQFMQYVAD